MKHHIFLTNLSKFKDAEKIFNKSLLLSKEIKDIGTEADTLYYQASIEWFKNDFEKGIKRAKNLLGFCERHELFKICALCANLLGSFYQQKRDIKTAQRYLDLALDGFYKIKHINALCAAMHNNALLLTQQGKLSQAEELFEKTLIQAQKINNKTIYCVALSNLANINEDSGRFDKAIKLNKMILKVDPYYVWSNYYLSMVFYKMGEIDKAKSILEKQIKKR